MHTESVIISAVCGFFRKLGEAYGKSAYHRALCRFFDCLGAFFGKLFKFILFSETGKRPAANIFSGIANAGAQFFHLIFGGIAKSVMHKSEESFLVRIVNLVFNNWHLISVRNYSEVLLAFTLVRLAIIRTIGRANDKYTLIFLAVSAVGLCVPASFSGLYQGSIIRRQMGLFDLKDTSALTLHIKPHISTTCSLAVGALLGLAILLPYWHVFVLCVIGIVFVFTKPNLSALLVVAVSPFVAENVFLVLAIILSGVWIMLHFAGDRLKLDIDGLDVCVIFIIILTICSAAASPVIKSSIGYASVLLLFTVLYFILRRAFTEKNNIRMFIDFLVIFCGAIAFSQLYKMTFSHSVFDKDRFSLLHSMEQSLRNTDISGKAFGKLFVVVLPFALCRAKMHRAFFGKLLYLVSAVLMSICVFVSYKYCIPALILTVLMFIVTDFRRIATIITVPVLISAGIAVYGVCAGLFDLSPYIPAGFSHPADGNIAAMLLYGTGLGTDALTAAYASFTAVPENIGTLNLYTSILFAAGVPGIIFLIATVRTVLAYSDKATRLSDSEKSPISNAFIISVIAFIITGFLPSKTYCVTVYMMFFMLAAMSGAMLDKTQNKEVR